MMIVLYMTLSKNRFLPSKDEIFSFKMTKLGKHNLVSTAENIEAVYELILSNCEIRLKRFINKIFFMSMWS